MLVQRAAYDQCTDMRLERGAAGPAQLHGLAERHTAMLANKRDNL
ncbi:hypothetical protein [Xylella taiwanensis]|nr:hypothetical protein [Xylella taiwanensis]